MFVMPEEHHPSKQITPSKQTHHIKIQNSPQGILYLATSITFHAHLYLVQFKPIHCFYFWAIWLICTIYKYNQLQASFAEAMNWQIIQFCFDILFTHYKEKQFYYKMTDCQPNTNNE